MKPAVRCLSRPSYFSDNMTIKMTIRESDAIMGAYSIAQAKAHLSALVEQVARGEAVTLTRRGKPVARIVSLGEPNAKPKIDLVRLRAFRATMPTSTVNSAVMVRKMRDQEDGW